MAEMSGGAKAQGWLLLVYRVPSEPSNNRVSVWRDLKRTGALYLQQCVCVLPRRRELRAALVGVREKIAKFGGSSNLFEIPRLPEGEQEAVRAGFRELPAPAVELLDGAAEDKKRSRTK